jgi:hypothetical protein
MDEMQLVRLFRRGLSDGGRHVEDAARTRLRDQIAVVRHPRSLKWLRFPLAAATAGAALVAFLVVPQLEGGDGTTSVEAAEFLSDLGEVAASQSGDSATGADAQRAEEGYRYTHTQGGGPRGEVIDMEMWVAPDGSGRVLARAAQDRGGGVSETLFGPDQPCQDPNPEKPNCNLLTYTDYSSYPTDPDDLFALIQSEAAAGAAEDAARGETPNESFIMFRIVGGLLAPAAPVELRSAAYEVAARIPGIELVGEVTDPLERPGVAVALVDEFWTSVSNGGEDLASGFVRTRLELIFDPDTAQLLAESMTQLEELEGSPEPAVSNWTAYLESGIVSTTDERPAAN